MQIRSTLKRRSFLAAAAGGAVLTAGAARAQDNPAAHSDGSYTYEVEKSPEEWRSVLSEEQFTILRDGKTEKNWTSDYARKNNPGTYHCVGCGLALYSSEYYSPQKIGFVFFDHGFPNAVMLGIDESDYNGALPEPEVFVEAHCRRCGGHLGHIIVLDGATPLHCINGTALHLRGA